MGLASDRRPQLIQDIAANIEMAANSPAARPSNVPALPTLRSRVTNGSSTFIGGDERSAWSRRFRDRLAAHLEGIDNPTAAETSLARRAATLEVELERAEGLLSGGGAVDLSAYGTATGALRRVLAALDAARKARGVRSPSNDATEAIVRTIEARYAR